MRTDQLSDRLCKALKDNLQGGKPRPPEPGVVLWNAFFGMSSTRTYHAAGPNPIQPSEIESWCRLFAVPLQPHHLRIILAMDDAWLCHFYSRSQPPEGVKILPPISKQPISAALMDAMLG